MFTSGSENGKYFETNRVNPIISIFFKTSLRDESNGTKHYGIRRSLNSDVISGFH